MKVSCGDGLIHFCSLQPVRFGAKQGLQRAQAVGLQFKDCVGLSHFWLLFLKALTAKAFTPGPHIIIQWLRPLTGRGKKEEEKKNGNCYPRLMQVEAGSFGIKRYETDCCENLRYPLLTLVKPSLTKCNLE